AGASVHTPVDLLATAEPDHFARAIAAVGRDTEVDTVVAIYVPPLALAADAVAGAIARGAAEVPDDKPVASVFLSSKGAPPNLASGRRGLLPSYSFPENAARALAAAVKYARWRERPRGTPAAPDLGAARIARDIARRSIDSQSEPHWLQPAHVAAL